MEILLVASWTSLTIGAGPHAQIITPPPELDWPASTSWFIISPINEVMSGRLNFTSIEMEYSVSRTACSPRDGRVRSNFSFDGVSILVTYKCTRRSTIEDSAAKPLFSNARETRSSNIAIVKLTPPPPATRIMLLLLAGSTIPASSPPYGPSTITVV
ncbi:hypothetical protein AG1IA_04818 [Rhizoctonia solani AG-1 IA]|uniref:Uncharacterized protein n=1 Tax=Thanatephorus cucumeris (strain AG1-IA) TaxID=983506 RepID=L8WWD9_THACA|nr:hypothetical protein AG1IA_04818 [Rhizoctonia solani AG-1 IA]